MFSYCLRFQRTGTFRSTDIGVANVAFANTFQGIEIDGADRASVVGCQFRKILRYVDEPQFGRAIVIQNATGVSVMGCQFDGAETATFGYPNAFPPSAPATRTSGFAITIDTSRHVALIGNVFEDWADGHVIFDVGDGEDGLYGPVALIGNLFRTSLYPTFANYNVVTLGRSATRRIVGGLLLGNMINSTPLEASPSATLFSASPLSGARALTLGNGASSLAAGDSSGEIAFYSGDGSSPGAGTKAKIEAFVNSSDGRGGRLRSYVHQTGSGGALVKWLEVFRERARADAAAADLRRRCRRRCQRAARGRSLQNRRRRSPDQGVATITSP